MKSLDLGLSGPLKFYKNTITLRFSNRDHAYYLETPDGYELQNGVTQTCGILDKSMFLIPWSCKMMQQKLLRTMPSSSDEFTGIKSILPISWSEFESLVAEAKKAHKEILADASDVGAEAHKWLEESIRWAIRFNKGVVDNLLDDRIPSDDRAKNCGLAALAWMRFHNVRWIQTETIVYSKKWKYAGTLDGLAEVDGVLSIVDWKSSNALRTEYAYQTAAYLKAREEEYSLTIPDRWILRLGKEDGKFEPWHFGPETIEDDFTAFILCLTLKRLHAIIESRISAYKKGRTATKKKEKE